MIACMILAIAAGACYFQFKKSYDDRQNKQVGQLIKDTCRRASHYAQLTNSQVLVLFLDTPHGKEIALSSDLKGSTALKVQSANRERLTGVIDLKFEPDLPSLENGCIELSFYPWGLEKSGQSLTIRFRSEEKPYTIALDSFAPHNTHDERASYALYPKEVLEDE